jgi:8-oxo-dGTP diphosphatase
VSRLACALLVDPRGWLLLQERDENAPIAPDSWGMVGGHVEPGEDFEVAVYRELAEETGIVWGAGLTLWRDEEFRYAGATRPHRYQLWTAPTELTDADITVGEGRQIAFVDPARIPDLRMGESAAYFVHAFLASDTYRSLAAG